MTLNSSRGNQTFSCYEAVHVAHWHCSIIPDLYRSQYPDSPQCSTFLLRYCPTFRIIKQIYRTYKHAELLAQAVEKEITL